MRGINKFEEAYLVDITMKVNSFATIKASSRTKVVHHTSYPDSKAFPCFKATSNKTMVLSLAVSNQTPYYLVRTIN